MRTAACGKSIVESLESRIFLSGAVTAADTPGNVGAFSPLTDAPIVAVNMILMHTGEVLMYQDGVAAQVFNPSTGNFTAVPNMRTNLICSGAAQLPDGRILLAGGDAGSSNVNLFDPATDTWSPAADMNFVRYYPTVTALPDGTLLAAGGSTSTFGPYLNIPEVYDPATGTWTKLDGADKALPNYPHIFVKPDGTLVETGASETPWPTLGLDIASQTWSTIDPTVVDGATSVMYRPGLIMKEGTAANAGVPGPAAATTYVLDTTQPNPSWRQTANMNFPRATNTNMVTLPDGNVMVFGGGTDISGQDLNTGVLPTEEWNPNTETWSVTASLAVPRLYHSTAVLLPDGRVLVGGGGRDTGVQDQDNYQIYSPNYLFRGARPTITSAPSSAIAYNGSFAVGTASPQNIASVVLVRPGAATHGFDQDQRYVPLSFSTTANGLTVQAPDHNLAPPGYYMLFVVDNTGVPSVASWVNFAPQASPTITRQPQNAVAAVGATATFTAAASGNPVPAVQWQVSTNGGATFSNVAGATSTTLSFSTSAGQNGNQYRAVFTNSQGSVATSAATLTISGSQTSTIFNNTTPASGLQNVSDPQISASGGVDLGVKFRSDVAGTITGIRFFKGSQNTGVHIGQLWSNTGQPLASATFSNETASGWQQVSFSTPVTISANTTYVASYHTTAPSIAYTSNGLASGGINNPPLHALANGVDGGNGVYNYDATPGNPVFPSSYNGQAPNYWVDVTFAPATVTPLTIFSPSAAPNSGLQNVNDSNITKQGGVDLGLKFRSDVAGSVTGVRFFKGSQNTGVHTGELWSSTGQPLASATFSGESASGWQQVTFSSPVAITANTTYIVSYHTTAPFIAYTANTLSGTGIDNPPLHALANGVDGGNAVYHYDLTPGTPAFPSVYNGQAPNYWVDVVLTSAAKTPLTLFSPSAAPNANLQNANDPNITTQGGVNLGLKFRSDVAGSVTGVRFFKGSQNTGVHIGQLWSSTGQLLASATFSNETASGWQQVTFSSAVAITANTAYIVSYHTTAPYIAYAPNALASSGIDNGPLHGLANGVDGGNSVYSYGPSSFPTLFNGQAANYWVDIVFMSP